MNAKEAATGRARKWHGACCFNHDYSFQATGENSWLTGIRTMVRANEANDMNSGASATGDTSATRTATSRVASSVPRTTSRRCTASIANRIGRATAIAITARTRNRIHKAITRTVTTTAVAISISPDATATRVRGCMAKAVMARAPTMVARQALPARVSTGAATTDEAEVATTAPAATPKTRTPCDATAVVRARSAARNTVVGASPRARAGSIPAWAMAMTPADRTRTWARIAARDRRATSVLMKGSRK